MKLEHNYGLSQAMGSVVLVENNCERDLNGGTLRDIIKNGYNTDCVIENQICKGCDASQNSSQIGDFDIRTGTNGSGLAFREPYSEEGFDFIKPDPDPEKDFFKEHDPDPEEDFFIEPDPDPEEDFFKEEEEEFFKKQEEEFFKKREEDFFKEHDPDPEEDFIKKQDPDSEEDFDSDEEDFDSNEEDFDSDEEDFDSDEEYFFIESDPLFENSTQTESDPLFENSTQTESDPLFENSTQTESDPLFENSTQTESGPVFEDSTQTESDPNPRKNYTHKYKHLWVLCEECYTLNYKRFLKEKLYICEGCGSHLKMNSSERIKLLVDPDTWDPMNEKMASLDPIEFHSEEDPYIDRINSYQKKTGLTEAIQTGIGQLNGIPVAMGVMEFGFMGGSMGSVVGEKITRLIEYATNQSLPLIIVCASGGARMQEGSLSLMQMAKISSVLYDFQTNQKLFYVSILTSPTTGGVTASFGMLGDIVLAEPDAYIAFAGKRVIELTLNKEVPEGSQETEYLFEKGLFDLVVPRNTLKSVLNELFRVHGFFPLNQNLLE
uniref:Acetyl-coenzyme A carboxylase carboxyl transferase subunit beta n=2 Tax=Triosteum himalayanum TaxID=134525 RepID=A0A649UBI2_9DIPS|nr:acetyl-CoA carboxylase carboxyltransferase beta subunit [Triosteum himalayanum]QGI24550.1 acetyl-CoA carboxylase carboxyltransferase beta subunit [Triosteum himalayanum]